jgi:adenylate cyclase
VAELVRRIAQEHPRVVGIDIVFAEPDRLSPSEIAREVPGLPRALADALAQLPPSDRDLAEAIAMVPTVLALALSSVQRFSLIVGIENSLVGISANHSAGARPG